MNENKKTVSPQTPKARKLCACGKTIRQKYYSICVKCRQARERKKKEDREITRVVKDAFK